MMTLVVWVGVDADGSKWGRGRDAEEARSQALSDYLAMMRRSYGPFRRYTRASVIRERGPTSWTDGDCPHDSPEALAAWAAGLATVRVTLEGATELDVLLGLCALLDCEGGSVVPRMRRLSKKLGGIHSCVATDVPTESVKKAT